MKPGVRDAVVESEATRSPNRRSSAGVTCKDIDPEALFPLVNTQALFRGRWGYRRGKMSAQEYRQLIDGTVHPLYQDLQHPGRGGRLDPARECPTGISAATPGKTICTSRPRGGSMCLPSPGRGSRLSCALPIISSRPKRAGTWPVLCVTIGALIGEETARLYRENAYHDYLMLHGFSVEVTDALAEYWHAVMRRELGIGAGLGDVQDAVTQQYQGSRYGFGYPRLPGSGCTPAPVRISQARDHRRHPHQHADGPEQTTSAIVVHHPQANISRYRKMSLQTTTERHICANCGYIYDRPRATR